MKKETLKETILNLLEKSGRKPMDIQRIAQGVSLKGKNLNRVKRTLEKMVGEGYIIRMPDGRYGVGDEAGLVELVVAIGNWTLFARLLPSLEVPLEDGVEPWPPDGRTPDDPTEET
jgi:DNA-binding IclR family transcriptional regulator